MAHDNWTPPDLRDRVALVTGASYGVGRGVAEVLGECGATVYITGRSTRMSPSGNHKWSVEETADSVNGRGGTGIAVPLDHSDDSQVEGLFEQIRGEHKRLDILVNNVWQWGPMGAYSAPAWEQPVERWDAMVGLGVRAQFVTTKLALPLMMDDGGLIAFTQERPGTRNRFLANLPMDVAATVQERMTRRLAHELKRSRVAVVLTFLGWVRSINMLKGLKGEVFEGGGLRMSKEEFFRRTQSAKGDSHACH